MLKGVERRVSGVWEDLATRLARFTTTGSSASAWSATWASRTQRGEGEPTPVEAQLADHLACYGAAVAHALAREPAPPMALELSAAFILGFTADGTTAVKAVELSVSGEGAGLNGVAFEEAVHRVSPDCEVWQAARRATEVRIRAALVPPAVPGAASRQASPAGDSPTDLPTRQAVAPASRMEPVQPREPATTATTATHPTPRSLPSSPAVPGQDARIVPSFIVRPTPPPRPSTSSARRPLGGSPSPMAGAALLARVRSGAARLADLPPTVRRIAPVVLALSLLLLGGSALLARPSDPAPRAAVGATAAPPETATTPPRPPQSAPGPRASTAGRDTSAAPTPASGGPARVVREASPAPASTRVLLDEPFRVGSASAGRWPSEGDGPVWLASEGGYRLSVRRPGQFVAVAAPVEGRFADVSVVGTLRKMGGPAGGGYGLVVRDQAPAGRTGTQQDGRFYVFEVGDRGQVGAWRRDEDRWIELLPWTDAAAVRPGVAPNELRVRAIGSRLTFTVNGVQVFSVEDGALAAGSVGVFAGGDQNEVLLERLLVEAPR